MTATTTTPAAELSGTAQPSTEQLIAAMAASLLPLAGPAGIAAAALVPAVEQLLERFRNPAAPKNFTIDELASIVASGSGHLAEFKRDVDALD